MYLVGWIRLEDEASGAYVDLTRAKKLMIDLLRGLQHAHSKNILHRDIKPANIMIGDSSEGKLSDFGLALPDLKKVDVSVLKQYQYWMHLAPEVNKLSDYTYLSDIYSCGITLYRLVNGDSYLPPLTVPEIRKLASEGKFPDRSNYRDFIPISLKRVINKAMNVDPSKRYSTPDKMRHALEKIILNINWIEKKTSNGIQWRAKTKNSHILLSKTENDNGTWDIVLKKGRNKTSLRRKNSHCFSNKNGKKADQIVRRTLQDFVLGRIR